MKRRIPRRSSSRLLGSKSGLTMLELIVALAILTIGIAGVLRAFSTSIASTKAAESYSMVSMLANQVASQLERQTTIEPGSLTGTFEDADGYTWAADIQPADSNGLMRTTITINWQVDSNPKQYSMVVCLCPLPAQTTTTDSSDSSTQSSSRGGG